MRLLGRVFVIFLAVLGSLTLLTGGVGLWMAVKSRPEPLAEKIVLAINLDAGISEQDHDSPLGKLGLSDGLQIKDVVEGLERAAQDPRVTGLVARLDNPSLGMAKVQELRDSIQSFRKAGKPALVFSSSLGEFGGATLPYFLATAFSEIWLQPSGNVALTGFVMQSPFFKTAMDHLGIQANFGARHEYKSAIEVFTQNKFTKESRETLQRLMDSWSKQTITGIAAARNLGKEQVTALMDRSPLLADEAKQAGLVDRLAYWDELEAELTAKGQKIVSLADYRDRLPAEANAVKVALIYGVGTVQSGSAEEDPLGEENVMSAARIGKAFIDAVKDPAVKAILFRIDSPGGSYTASDSIWRAVGNARRAGKPVVVSMGDVAASGGYFAAMAADRIVAQPGTITGSIGVFAGKFVVAELWKKLGVSWDELHQGENATMWSVNSEFSPAAWNRVNVMLDHIYADFTGKAEESRKISAKDMDHLARGRVWPGDEAQRLGLVDALGGFSTALGLIRQLAHLPSQMPIALVTFPRPQSPTDYILSLAKGGHLPAALAEARNLSRTLTRVQVLFQPFSPLLGQSDAHLLGPSLTAP